MQTAVHTCILSYRLLNYYILCIERYRRIYCGRLCLESEIGYNRLFNAAASFDKLIVVNLIG